MHFMANPERENLTELQVARFKFFYDLLKTVRHLFRLAKWMGICVFSYLSIDALAGKTTILNAVFKYAAGNKLAVVLPWLTVIFLLFWALLERALRRRKTAAMQEHIRRLETSFDPARTGTNLLPDGRTNPKDRLDVDR